MEKQMTELMAMTVEEIGESIFRAFPYAEKIPADQRDELARKADERGQLRAAELAAEYAGLKPSEIAAENGISVVNETSEKANDRFVKFAEFHVKNKKILLNQNAVAYLEEALAPPMATEIILCHELFHFFEHTRWGDLSKEYSFTDTLPMGIKVKRSILPMSEIAANGFTRTLLQLSFQPKVIEKIYFSVARNHAAEAEKKRKKQAEETGLKDKLVKFAFPKR